MAQVEVEVEAVVEVEVDVPPFFICPISLEMMKDPVTLFTGITYDRESIEKWIYSSKNNTCPVTKQVLSDDASYNLTPNHTLLRLIQGWCTLNSSHGFQRIPTPKAPINKAQIQKLLKDAQSPHLQLQTLRKLRSLAMEKESNRRSIESAGAVDILVSIINTPIPSSSEEEGDSNDENIKLFDFDLSPRARDEALSTLYNLQVSEAGVKSLISSRNGQFVESLMEVLQSGSYESRVYAVLLFRSMLEVADPMPLMSLRQEFFVEIVNVLRDQVSSKAVRAALEIFGRACPWGRNKIKAVESGAVGALIEFLLDSSDRRVCEMILFVLDELCGCAEGRAELLKHDAGLAIVSKKILRVSQVASEKAVRILYKISKFSSTPSVVQDMLQLGVASKLCLVIQAGYSGRKCNEKAVEILKLHSRAWKNSPCIPTNFISSYPS